MDDGGRAKKKKRMNKTQRDTDEERDQISPVHSLHYSNAQGTTLLIHNRMIPIINSE